MTGDIPVPVSVSERVPVPARPGEDPVALIRAAFAALNRRDLDACTRMMTEDFGINIAGMPFRMTGRAAWRRNVEVMRTAFPDFRVTVDDAFGTGDRVAVRVTIRGTHLGEFRGLPATGRRVEYSGIELYGVAGGLLTEEWIAPDTETLTAQLTGEAGAPG
ncbi:ester cyclase [Streptomyces sp. NPDC006798]|uniref:ester cyclase n=1 Tax=Streptomyces sp. NPDC006798 TaxID=3155462 RepID=UPI0033D29971